MDATRRLKEEQRMEYIRAQEEDLRKLTSQADAAVKKKIEEEEKVNFEKTKNELAKSKKSELRTQLSSFIFLV